jgi:hypothetical protein
LQLPAFQPPFAAKADPRGRSREGVQVAAARLRKTLAEFGVGESDLRKINRDNPLARLQRGTMKWIPEGQLIIRIAHASVNDCRRAAAQKSTFVAFGIL